MRTYGQYCPIARAAEILAERWTPLIVRNIHAGCGTYGEILAGAPGLSHTLLTQRLRHLIKAGVITTTPKARAAAGVRYMLTDAGDELWPVLLALGAWGERWVELRDEHTNPRFLLWTWATTYLAHANLPDRRSWSASNSPTGPTGSAPSGWSSGPQTPRYASNLRATPTTSWSTPQP